VLRYAAQHGAVVRAFHQRLRELHAHDFAAVFETLRTLFDEALASAQDEEGGEARWQQLRAVAQRCALAYGNARARSETLRSDVAQVCALGIDWTAANAHARQSFPARALSALVQRLDEAVAQRVLDFFGEKMRGLDFADADYADLATFRAHLQTCALLFSSFLSSLSLTHTL
jgi:hypothetical protein